MFRPTNFLDHLVTKFLGQSPFHSNAKISCSALFHSNFMLNSVPFQKQTMFNPRSIPKAKFLCQTRSIPMTKFHGQPHFILMASRIYSKVLILLVNIRDYMRLCAVAPEEGGHDVTSSDNLDALITFQGQESRMQVNKVTMGA